MFSAPYFRKTAYHTGESEINGTDLLACECLCPKQAFKQALRNPKASRETSPTPRDDHGLCWPTIRSFVIGACQKGGKSSKLRRILTDLAATFDQKSHQHTNLVQHCKERYQIAAPDA
jgi:hypothetical protein